MFKGIVAAIPARGGSKRIPNKNIKLLGNYPLLSYSIFTARGSYFIDKTIVSTDSPEIAKVAYESDSEIIMRPKELSEDNSTDLGWVLHFLGEFKEREGYYPKNIAFLRPTSPFRLISIVDSIIQAFDSKNTSLRSLEPISEAVEKHFKLSEEGLLKSICKCIKLEDTNNPNQVFSTSYKANGYCDILKSEYILDTKSLYGNKIQGYITENTIELDTLDDWKRAEFLMKEKLNVLC